jgi:hypothetical protein
MSTLLRRRCEVLTARLQIPTGEPKEAIAGALKVEAAEEAPRMPRNDDGRAHLYALIARRPASASRAHLGGARSACEAGAAFAHTPGLAVAEGEIRWLRASP